MSDKAPEDDLLAHKYCGRDFILQWCDFMHCDIYSPPSSSLNKITDNVRKYLNCFGLFFCLAKAEKEFEMYRKREMGLFEVVFDNRTDLNREITFGAFL